METKPYLVIVTPNHLSKGDLLAVTIERFVGVDWLTTEVRHGDVGGVGEIHSCLLSCPG